MEKASNLLKQLYYLTQIPGADISKQFHLKKFFGFKIFCHLETYLSQNIIEGKQQKHFELNTTFCQRYRELGLLYFLGLLYSTSTVTLNFNKNNF